MKNRNKIFFSLLLLVALCVSSGYSQSPAPAGKLPATVSIANVTATAGNRISVPVNASDLVNLSAISLSIQYDPAVLTWIGADSLAPGIAAANNFLANAVSGSIKIAWFSLTPVSISNGKMFNLNFTYNGGTSPLNFVIGSQCELSDITGNTINTNFVSGSVTPIGQTLPSIPALITPSNNSTGNSLNPQLVWGKASLALSYSLLVATDINFNNIVKNQTGITDTTFNLTNLSSGTQYFWKVMAVNSTGNSDYSAVWNFTTIFNYTITTLASPPAGGTTSGNGTFPAGTTDTVKAVANQGYTFANWTEGANVVSSNPAYIFTVNSSRTLTANFTLNSYTITTNSNPANGGTTSGGGTYQFGKVDTLKAVSNQGYSFVNWTEGTNIVSTDPTYIFTVNSDRTLTANFNLNSYIITTNSNPSYAGSTSGGGTYFYGQTDTVKASPTQGFVFVNWTEGAAVVSTDPVYIFTVNSARTLTANFTFDSYSITTNSNPANGGTTAGGGNYLFGQTDTVKAVANQGYTFVNWTEGTTVVSTNAVYIFAVTSARTLTANFLLNSYTITTNSNPANGGTTSGSGNFTFGQTDTVKAVANQGYTFVNWTEGSNVVSTNPVYFFTVDASRTLTANFTTSTYAIIANNNPPNGGSTTGGGNYTYGQTANLKAIPNQGYIFVYWTEGANIISSNPEFSFTVTGSRTLTANYNLKSFTITTNSNPANGGTTSGGGTYFFSQVDTVKAVASQGYTFVNWTEGTTVVSTSPVYFFSISGDRTLTANFSLNTYTITTNSNPQNGGTTSGFGVYSYGQIDTLKAVANQGYSFVNWTEGSTIVSTSPTYIFTVNGPRTLTANFNINSYTITTNTNPANGGTATGGGNYFYGQTDTLKAVANQGYAFVNWTEGTNVVSTDPVYFFTVNANRTLTANFSLNSYRITTNSNPANGGTTTGDGTFNHGLVDTVKAIPAQGYTFVNWTEGTTVVSTDQAYIFTVTSARTLTANFSINSYTITTFSNPLIGGTTSGGGNYNFGVIDTVKAVSNQGYTFINWTEGTNVVSTDPVYFFTVNGARTLTANFSLNSYVIATSSNPANGGTTSGAGNYFYGQVDTVKAVANQGYTFVNWTEGSTVVSANPVYFFTVNGARTLVANFSLNSYVIATNSNPANGGTTTGAGSYSYGQVDTVKAVAAPGYTFVNWTEGTTVVSANAVYFFTVNGARTLTANFSLNSYLIAASSNPANGGTITGAGNYSYGQVDTLNAIPAQGYTFINWTEGTTVVSTNAVYIFTVNAARTLVANFTLASYSIVTSSNPQNGGTTTGGGNYLYGQTDTLKAVANQGYTFINWSEGTNVVSTDPVYIFTVNSSRTLVANFSLNSYLITTNSFPVNGGTTSGGGTYFYGKVDTLKAVPSQGFVFANWTEGTNVVSTDPVYIFTVSGARTLTANFCSILVTSPNGGELWISGNTYSITWNSSNIANLKIEYSTNNGSSWQQIALAVPAASGLFDWVIPNTPATQCLVKLSDASNSAISDQSDIVFTITNSTTTPTLILGTAAGAPGDSLDVSLNVKNLVNIGAITLAIQFDTTKVSFGRALNLDPKIANAMVGSSKGTIMFLWDGVPSISLSDNKLLDLRFFYKGSTDRTPVTFKINQCEITDGSGGKFPVSYINGAILPGVNVSGTLVYAKTTAYPLANVKVYLKDPVKILDSTFTSETGTFIFKGKAPGTYKFGFVCTKPWGGVNSTDALLIRKYISFSATFDSLQIKAADVNRSTTINSTDALLIRRRVASIDSTFAVGDWVFEEPVFTVGSASVDLTIRCLSTGDVNASYSPVLAKANSEKTISFNNHKLINNTFIDLPITLNKNVSLGAVTLYIDYDPASLQISGVTSALPEMTYSISNGRISIAWDDVNPVTLNMNAPFIVLKAKVLNTKGLINLTLSPNCELADPNGKAIQDNLINMETVNLNLPKQFELFTNYPNPFNPSTTIMYSLPEDMTVSLIIFDVLGREVKTLVNETMKAGTYSATWLGNDNHGSKVASGTYIYKLKGNNSVSIKKMVILK